MANSTLEMVHGMLYGKGLRFGHPSGLARVIAAMTGDHADVIPFFGPQIHDHAMMVAKVPARKYYWDAELLVDTHLAIDRWYSFDSDTIIADAYNFEVEALGGKMIYSDNAMPTVDVSHPLITEASDLDKLGPFDPSKGRIPMAVEVGKLFLKKAPGPFAGGFFCSHWSLLCQAMGYPKAVRALKRDKGFATALFDWANDRVLYPYMQVFSKAGVKNANGADAWACFPDLTPELIEEWVVPYALKLRQQCKKELGMTVAAGTAAGDYCEEDPAKFDKALMFKCWEAATKTMPLNVAFSGMGRTQDWDMTWLREFALKKGKGGHQLPIMASLNGRFMRDSRPDQIVAKIAEWIDIMSRDGRMLVFIGNVPADTPPVNIHTAVKAVRTLGKYPIAADLASIKIDPPTPQPFDEWLKGQPEADVIFKAREWKPEDKKVFA
ncbi:MAG: uroporphyrinogen decarboxylase family protein [Anaerolineales bacterium]|jgi:uroporphyrinogen-III decarboxylase